MAYGLEPIRGITRLVDTAAPTVPLDSMPADGGTLPAATAFELGVLVDSYFSSLEFTAVGDGVADDNDAIQAALAYAVSSGVNTLRFPPGSFRYTETIATHVDNFRIIGAGIGRTNLIFAGSGPAIDADFSANGGNPGLRFEVQGIKLNASDASGTGATHGIRIKHTGTTTGEGHVVRDVEVVGFTGGSGLQLSNVERCLIEQVHLYGNATGLAMDNIGNLDGNGQQETGATGISNTLINVRAHANTGEGFDIANQTALTAINCQAIHNGTTGQPTLGSAQFRLRGSCSGCTIANLDAEKNTAPKGVGLSVSGPHHTISVKGADLDQGIRGISCTFSIFLDQRFASSVAAGVLLDALSTGNKLIVTSYQITDQGTSNTQL